MTNLRKIQCFCNKEIYVQLHDSFANDLRWKRIYLWDKNSFGWICADCWNKIKDHVNAIQKVFGARAKDVHFGDLIKELERS